MNISLKVMVYLLLLFVTVVFPTTVYAHGAKIEYSISSSIELIAKYDSGEPMAEAQVTVYSPDNPSAAWLTGTCDEDGRFIFTPDASVPGTWDIQVRQAGHGDMIHIKIAEGSVTGGGSSDYSMGQIVVMSVCVIWGLLGTALFFKRRKS